MPSGSIDAGDDCLACVHDLMSYLRRDDEVRSIRRKLGGWQVLQRKLLPLIRTRHRTDREMTYSVTKLLVMLTMPAEGYDESAEVLMASEVECLQQYKEAFLDDALLGVFVDMMTDPLSRDGRERNDGDNLLIELVLTLFRNLLHVPNPSEAACKSMTSKQHLTHLHERFLLCLHKNVVFDTCTSRRR